MHPMIKPNPDAWRETFYEEPWTFYDPHHRWIVYRYVNGEKVLIASSTKEYATCFDAADAANEYCDQRGIKARWALPMATGVR